MDEAEQYEQAFGRHINMSSHCRYEITKIRANYPGNDEFILQTDDADEFSDLAWTLLGRCIANNTQLKDVFLNGCNLTNEKMALLFREFVRSATLERIYLSSNEFGIDGLRSMISFLENAPQLKALWLRSNDNINTECFELVIRTLHGRSVEIERLYFGGCNITDISVLNTYNLPNLRDLYLTRNNIGREGIMTLSNLLQQEGSTLTKLHLMATGMGDEEAEIIASSLIQNTKLEELNLLENNITERGCLAFFKLLNDVSSIENTYNSNHTLRTVSIAEYVTSDLLDSISEACIENRTGSNPNSIGRLKVIRTQLKSQNREKYCKLQGIQCPSNIFADIDPNLLPNILGLIGESHGQTELYTALVPMAPDLLSYIDRKALLTDELSKTADEYARIKAKLSDLKKRMALLDEGDSKQAAMAAAAEAEDKEVVLSGKKRGRSQETKI